MTSLSTSPQLTRLCDSRPGDLIRVIGIDTDKHLKKRLLSMGVANQSHFQVLQRRGHAVVVGNETSRIAIGGDMSEKILVQAV